MGAFQAGFQLGQSAFNQAERNRLLQVQEDRAAEEFARKKQDWQKADELEAQVKGLSEQITNPNASNYRIGGSPVGLKMPGQAAPADAAPGDMPSTDFSFGPAAAGGLKAPKAFALADTPGAAVAPAPDAVGLRGSAFPASGVSLKAGPSASEEQGILAKIALLKGDIQGFNSARQAGKAADKDAVFAEAMKAPMPEVVAAAPKLNSMGIPLLYTGKSKDGKYTFLKTEADGYTPVDGSQFTLNESQMRQFYAASQLADKGFGADAMNLLSAANKDVADYIGKWNSTQSAVATANNTAQGKVDEAEYKRGMLGVAQQNANTNEEYRRMLGAAAQERAAGGGSNGPGALWAQAEKVAAQGHYGGSVERAYAALKRGQDRGGLGEEATKLEVELRKQGLAEPDIQRNIAGFMQGRGVAPPAMVAALRSGINPKTGKPYTPEDYQQWDAAFPNMPVEDILGASPLPSQSQMDAIRRDAAANGIAAPTFAWDVGGRVTKGAVPGAATPKATGLQRRGGVDSTPASYDVKAIEAAQDRIATAEKSLQKFGLRQRAADPAGYAAAQQAYEEAVAAGKGVIPSRAEMARIRAEQARARQGAGGGAAFYPHN